MNQASHPPDWYVFDVGTDTQPLWLVADYTDDNGMYYAKLDPAKIGPAEEAREAFSRNRQSLINVGFTFGDRAAALDKARELYGSGEVAP